MDQQVNVKLVLDRQERFNLKRAWFVNAWRLLNDKGQDMVQPWFSTRGSALLYAKKAGWIVTNASDFKRKA